MFSIVRVKFYLAVIASVFVWISQVIASIVVGFGVYPSLALPPPSLLSPLFSYGINKEHWFRQGIPGIRYLASLLELPALSWLVDVLGTHNAFYLILLSDHPHCRYFIELKHRSVLLHKQILSEESDRLQLSCNRLDKLLLKYALFLNFFNIYVFYLIMFLVFFRKK
jgi:hypothetical protein